ncbi:MAG: cation-transporting P-type ATPase [Akkermansia muciniphila]
MKSAAHHQGLSEQQVLENRTRYGVNSDSRKRSPCGSNFWRNFQTPSLKFCWWPCSCP